MKTLKDIITSISIMSSDEDIYEMGGGGIESFSTLDLCEVDYKDKHVR